MPAFDPLDHPKRPIAEILKWQLECAESRQQSTDPEELKLAARHASVAFHIRQAMANREQYDRDHDAKQTRECEPL